MSPRSILNHQCVAHHNLPAEDLIQYAINKKEGVLAANGALCVSTGKRTGRSPRDRFIVEDAITKDVVDWGVINQPLSPDIFKALWDEACAHLNEIGEAFVSQHHVGADQHYAVSVHIITELAWHSLFARDLFIQGDLEKTPQEKWTVLSVPSFRPNGHKDGVNSDAAIILNFTERQILVAGTYYAGEIKKSLFTVLNFLLPKRDVLPMHCSANVGENGETALFFGLSGTGKTTLSADPERYLIGDDEHGWSPNGLFNFEGGCYAKCIHLSHENEPVIWNAIRYGSVIENVILDHDTLEPRYDDDTLTQNTRAVYPLDFIEKRTKRRVSTHPNHVIFLTCDLYGVLPPVSYLTPEQAFYYFLSGYTAMVGSTEVGQEGIRPTFSACFGAPFFPRSPHVYGALLKQKIHDHQSSVWLVNTGWTGGVFGEGGKRFDIPTTRAIVKAIVDNQLNPSTFIELPKFHFQIPTHIEGVEKKLLNPKECWGSKAFEEAQDKLIASFQENFRKFQGVAPEIIAAGPSS